MDSTISARLMSSHAVSKAMTALSGGAGPRDGEFDAVAHSVSPPASAGWRSWIFLAVVLPCGGLGDGLPFFQRGRVQVDHLGAGLLVDVGDLLVVGLGDLSAKASSSAPTASSICCWSLGRRSKTAATSSAAPA
jgi:hypothetical protein